MQNCTNCSGTSGSSPSYVLAPLGAAVLNGTAHSTACATRNCWQSKARPWIVTTHGLYTRALWQLREPLKLVNLFEDRQSTPERTLRWLPSCALAFRMLKANQRLALFSSPAHSVVQRSLANNCFILSLNIYQSTYFGFNWDDINLYQQRSSKLLLGRPWLVGRYLPHIFRWLGIAPALDPAITLTAAPHVCSRRDTRSQSLDRDKSCNKCSGRGFLC